MKKSLLFSISLLLVSQVNILHAESNIAAGKEKSASCAGCHGEDGNSQASNFPKLAGQHVSYLAKQMSAFKTGARKDAMMGPMVAGLSDQDMLDIAGYYAAAKLAPNKLPEVEKAADADSQAKADEEQTKLVEEGRYLYRYGDLNSQVSACISCHGPFGDGNKPASFPVLKAQHADYLIKTLTDFKNNSRSNNPENMMHMIAKKLSDREIKAVSYYLSTLK